MNNKYDCGCGNKSYGHGSEYTFNGRFSGYLEKNDEREHSNDKYQDNYDYDYKSDYNCGDRYEDDYKDNRKDGHKDEEECGCHRDDRKDDCKEPYAKVYTVRKHSCGCDKEHKSQHEFNGVCRCKIFIPPFPFRCKK